MAKWYTMERKMKSFRHSHRNVKFNVFANLLVQKWNEIKQYEDATLRRIRENNTQWNSNEKFSKTQQTKQKQRQHKITIKNSETINTSNTANIVRHAFRRRNENRWKFTLKTFNTELVTNFQYHHLITIRPKGTHAIEKSINVWNTKTAQERIQLAKKAFAHRFSSSNSCLTTMTKVAISNRATYICPQHYNHSIAISTLCRSLIAVAFDENVEKKEK